MKAELATPLRPRAIRPSRHFSYEANELGELERVFREYGETGKGRTRTYVHDDAEAANVTASPPGNFTAWAPFDDGSDLLFYEGLHGCGGERRGQPRRSWPT